MLLALDIFYLKGEINSSTWSTKTFLYEIREPRYKQIKMGHQISKFLNIGQSSVLKSDVPYYFCSLIFYRNGFEFEACLMVSPLKWDMSQTTKMFIAREIMRKSRSYQISRYY